MRILQKIGRKPDCWATRPGTNFLVDTQVDISSDRNYLSHDDRMLRCRGLEWNWVKETARLMQKWIGRQLLEQRIRIRVSPVEWTLRCELCQELGPYTPTDKWIPRTIFEGPGSIQITNIWAKSYCSRACVDCSHNRWSSKNLTMKVSRESSRANVEASTPVNAQGANEKVWKAEEQMNLVL